MRWMRAFALLLIAFVAVSAMAAMNGVREQDRDVDRVENRSMEQDTDRTRDEIELVERVSANAVQDRRRAVEDSDDLPTPLREAVREQEQARVAARAIEQVGLESGWCNASLCENARTFEARINESLRLEERMRTRSVFARMLFGGDRAAARRMVQVTEQNRETIRALNASIERCPCTNETRLMLREQLRYLEREQLRLDETAREQLGMRGLFRWFG